MERHTCNMHFKHNSVDNFVTHFKQNSGGNFVTLLSQSNHHNGFKHRTKCSRNADKIEGKRCPERFLMRRLSKVPHTTRRRKGKGPGQGVRREPGMVGLVSLGNVINPVAGHWRQSLRK